MDRFRHVLVGVDLEPDGSDLAPGARRALEQARWLAEVARSRVRLVHSTWRDRYVEPLAGGVHLVSEGPPPSGAEALARAREGFREAGTRVDVVVAPEPPWEALARLAEEERADLVLVGKRSRDEDGRRLGSVSKKLVHACPVPVWVVEPGHVGPVRRIVAGTDFTAAGDLAVSFAAELARAAGAELWVAHAVPPTDFVAPGLQAHVPPLAPLDVQASLDAARRRIERDLARPPLGGLASARVHVALGGPHHVLRELVERERADLLVVGAVSRGGLSRLLLGSTAEGVLETVGASVLAVRPPLAAGAAG